MVKRSPWSDPISYYLLEERYQLKAQGYDLEKVTIRVSSELGINPEQVWAAGKRPLTVKARSLLCYWAVRKLGFSATELSKKLGVSQPSVSISVNRGEKIVKTGQSELVEDYIVIILCPQYRAGSWTRIVTFW